MVHQPRVDSLQQVRGGAFDDLDPVQVELDARRNSIQHSQLVSMGLNGKSDHWFCKGKGDGEWEGRENGRGEGRETEGRETEGRETEGRETEGREK